MKVYCVIPAYNEEKNITSVIRGIKSLVDRVVVVDDGSDDDTCRLAEEAGAVVLRHVINRGQGAALRTGTAYSLKHQSDIIVHFDADGQFSSQDITKVVLPIKQSRADVVFGSRFLNGQPDKEMPWAKRYFIMPLAKAVNRIFFKIDLTDPQSGFRAMSAAAAAKIDWQQDRMAHCSEIMFMVKKNNFRVSEVPIKIAYRHFGQNFFDGFKILKDLFIAMLIG